jgi:hypothetical protein
MDETQYRHWRIARLASESSRKMSVCRLASPFHEPTVPKGPDRGTIVAEVGAPIDGNPIS